MTLLGVDLNATRARAVSGPAGVPPRPLPLDGAERDLPMALSLEGRKPTVGRDALALARRLPHLTCFDFLSQLNSKRVWSAGKQRIDADQAMTLVCERLKPQFAGAKGAVLALPAYLTRPQATRLVELANQAKLGVLGSVATPLALARIAHGHHPWHGLAVVIDVDDHALTWTAILVDEPAGQHARARVIQSIPALGLQVWKDRLIDGIADRCIRQSRRDPRESGDAEQGLFDQLDHALEGYRQGKMVEVVVQAGHWFQNLFLPPADLGALCAEMVRQVTTSLRPLLAAAQADGPPEVLLATAAVARLPGVLPALQEHLGPRARVEAFPADAVAQASHELAADWKAIGAGHHEAAIPLNARSLASRPTAGMSPAARPRPRELKK